MTAIDLRVGPGHPDAPQVAALLAGLDRYLASLYAPEDNHILDANALKAPAVDFLVAEVDGMVVGCGATRRMAGEPGTGGAAYGEIKRMVVDPAHRGRGIAAALLQALERRLAERDVHLALLETGRDQHAAVRLYGRHGYRRRGPFAGYPENGLSVFYEKALPR